MKKKSLLTLIIVVLSVLSLTISAVQAESYSEYVKKLLSCSSSGVYYEDGLKPFLKDPSLVGGAEWIDFVADMRSDNGIACGYISSRPPEENLDDYADDIYDAAHFTTMGLEFRVLALENPKISNILNAEADKMIAKADELFGKVLSAVDLD